MPVYPRGKVIAEDIPERHEYEEWMKHLGVSLILVTGLCNLWFLRGLVTSKSKFLKFVKEDMVNEYMRRRKEGDKRFVYEWFGNQFHDHYEALKAKNEYVDMDMAKASFRAIENAFWNQGVLAFEAQLNDVRRKLREWLDKYFSICDDDKYDFNGSDSDHDGNGSGGGSSSSGGGGGKGCGYPTKSFNRMLG